MRQGNFKFGAYYWYLKIKVLFSLLTGRSEWRDSWEQVGNHDNYAVAGGRLIGVCR
jgi:hypothetical protein